MDYGLTRLRQLAGIRTDEGTMIGAGRRRSPMMRAVAKAPDGTL